MHIQIFRLCFHAPAGLTLLPASPAQEAQEEVNSLAHNLVQEVWEVVSFGRRCVLQCGAKPVQPQSGQHTW